MPYIVEWVEPKVVVHEGDVSVYFTYRNDEVGQGENTYHFVTNPDETEGDDETCFDVRDLAAWKSRRGEDFDAIVEVLRAAISSGELTRAGVAG